MLFIRHFCVSSSADELGSLFPTQPLGQSQKSRCLLGKEMRVRNYEEHLPGADVELNASNPPNRKKQEISPFERNHVDIRRIPRSSAHSNSAFGRVGFKNYLAAVHDQAATTSDVPDN